MKLDENLQTDLSTDAQTYFSSLLQDEIINTILRQLQSRFNSLSCSIWAYDREIHKFLCVGNTHNMKPSIVGYTVGENDGLLGFVRINKFSTFSGEAETDFRHSKEVEEKLGFVVRSILCVPIIVKGEVIGALEVIDSEPSKFCEMDLRFVEEIVNITIRKYKSKTLYHEICRI